MCLSAAPGFIKILDMHVCFGGGREATRARPGGESGELTEGFEVFDGHKLDFFDINGVSNGYR
jgi:hypothetical protein